jgi:hypothetical protein
MLARHTDHRRSMLIAFARSSILVVFVSLFVAGAVRATSVDPAFLPGRSSSTTDESSAAVVNVRLPSEPSQDPDEPTGCDTEPNVAKRMRDSLGLTGSDLVSLASLVRLVSVVSLVHHGVLSGDASGNAVAADVLGQDAAALGSGGPAYRVERTSVSSAGTGQRWVAVILLGCLSLRLCWLGCGRVSPGGRLRPGLRGA